MRFTPASIFIVTAAAVVTATDVKAGADLVKFPADFANGIHYTTVHRGNIKQDLFTGRAAIDAVKAGQPIPSGTVITPVDSRDGKLFRYVVMEKRAGWGAEYPAAKRNGEWEFQAFNAGPYRGVKPIKGPIRMGHEYCGIVEEVGSDVQLVKPGQFVIGSFFASDNTCPNCRAGYQSSCMHRELVGTAQASLVRVPLADGTLVATPGLPLAGMIPDLLMLSDVMGTGWFAAVAADVKPGKTVAVVGDGAVGLLGDLSAKQMGASRTIAMSRHEARQKLACEFGATDIVTERGGASVARIKELTGGVGADSVLECVGTQEA